MFCPQCRAEYRPGFSRCADCEVDLVNELPQTALAAPLTAEEESSSDDPFVSFWKGHDPRIHAELCELLAQNRIPYRSLRRQERLFAFSPHIAYAIGIPFSQFDRAEALIQDAYTVESSSDTASVFLPNRADTRVSRLNLLEYTGAGSAATSNAWEDAMASPTGMQEGFVTLWAGEDPAFHATLLERLQAASIEFVDRNIGDEPDTSPVDPFSLSLNPRFGFQVAVHTSKVAAAEGILEKLLDEEPQDIALAETEAPAKPAQPRPSASAAGPGTTAAVWSGGDQAQADFLVQALKENEIPVLLTGAAGSVTVFVPPAEETLAREIIREILEGQPPE